MTIFKSTLLYFVVFAPSSFALPTCNINMAEGTTCEVRVTDLKPTQFSVGMIEVQERARKISHMDDSERHDYLEDHVTPLVIGLDGFYPTDRHHLARALLIARGERSKLVAEIQRNWSDKSTTAFWQAMVENNFVYLYNEQGVGPLNPTLLPTRIADLRDDPYRSLVWGVQDEGAIGECNIPFYEFDWASYFRPLISQALIQRDFAAAKHRAESLARSPNARDLPGFVGHH